MDDLRAQIEAVLRGKDVKKSKPKDKVSEKEETYKDMYKEVFEQKEYPDDDSEEDEEFNSPSEEEAEKNHPDYKQDVALIRMMLNKKFKEKLNELKGKK